MQYIAKRDIESATGASAVCFNPKVSLSSLVNPRWDAMYMEHSARPRKYGT